MKVLNMSIIDVYYHMKLESIKDGYRNKNIGKNTILLFVSWIIIPLAIRDDL